MIAAPLFAYVEAGFAPAVAPDITGASAPNPLYAGGGQGVALIGKAFVGVTEATIDGISVPIASHSNRRVNITTLDHMPGGPFDITLTTPAGTATLAAFINVTRTPLTFVSITPDHGDAAGGSSHAIVGTGFYSINRVNISSVDVGTNGGTMNVINDSEIDITVDPSWDGPGLKDALLVDDADVDQAAFEFTYD